MTPTRPSIVVAFIAFTMVTVVWVSSPDFASIRWMSHTRLVKEDNIRNTTSHEGQTKVTTRRASRETETEIVQTTSRIQATPDIQRGEPSLDESNIFFMETSCWEVGKQPPSISANVAETGLHLSRRAACTIESAATANPKNTIYLLHTCPVNMTALLCSPPSPQTAALRVPNVRLWVKPIAELFEGSPLEEWISTGQLATSHFPREHTSDVLRYLLLWTYSGVYLDTDVLIRRPLPAKLNFASAESTTLVESAVLALGLDAAGRRLAKYLLEEIRVRFRGDIWGHNGPMAVTRALIRLCNTNQVSNMTSEHCRGFGVFPQEEFFAVPYSEWKSFFNETQADSVMKRVANSYGVHFWNKLSHVQNVILDSGQPYAQLARQYCPRVVEVAGDFL